MLTTLLLSSLAMAGDVDLRLGVGLPDLAQLYAGISPTPAWELHAAAGTNLGLVTWFTASVGAVWRPLRWESGAHHLSAGAGPDLLVGPASTQVAVIGGLSLDGRYAWHRPGAAAGLVLATRWGLGATTDLGTGPPDRLEPALMFQVLQAGVTF